jgi:DNA-binding LacI/PurR family transcriptional regulator
MRVVQNKLKMGQIAARLLLNRIQGEGSAEPEHVLVPADLIPAGERQRPEARTNT